MRSVRRIRAWMPCHHSTLLLLAALLVPAPAPADGPTGTVLLSQQCDYLLLDLAGRQALLKLLDGEAPQPGDRLTADSDLMPRDFSTLVNQRTDASIRVWVDIVERSTTRALNRYGQYCQ
ncbi:hypothetical protein A167_03729 [Alcanivorax sp. S71-1-4]|uniref:hypothetical protein n=1 Tax=Alcanivorax sp. S71-1-4 TaxID=1177159 RepID=UPI00135817DE|nr:hypothetical protein [Alcanivorax sp. S71-1-4]KAF0804309.1 hypothetical protein A167_03729 [Alcanivorax sp. S71-1-4]